MRNILVYSVLIISSLVSTATAASFLPLLDEIEKCIPKFGNPLPNNFVVPDLAIESRAAAAVLELLSPPSPHPDLHKNVTDIILDNGYPLEVHEITTKKGYKLNFYRIPHGKSELDAKRLERPPVILQHGLFTYSGCWLATYAEDNFAFNLADNGYDVWMGNIRGTIPSQGHINADISPEDYWGFSWEEMGTDDIPSAIDYILNATKEEKLFYVGHSMGSTMIFSGLSLRPEYVKKIRLVTAIAPVGHLYHSTSALRAFSPIEVAVGLGNSILAPILPNQFTPNTFNEFLSYWVKVGCTPLFFSELVCTSFVFAVMGYDYRHTNMTQLPVLLGHFLNPTSFKTMRHYAQSMLHDSFARFDYGIEGNFDKYGRCTPPEYNLSKLKMPVALIHSQNDALANQQDVFVLASKLPNVVLNYSVPLRHWNHVDYFVGKGVKSLVIEPMLKIMKMY